MARTALTKSTVTNDAGVNSAAAGFYQTGDNTNGMVLDAGGKSDIILHAKNTNASARTVTIKAGTGGHLGGAWRAGYGDLTVTVPATTGEQFIRITDTARFMQTDGNIHVDISGAGVTIAVLSVSI
jgi:hypothetical protein